MIAAFKAQPLRAQVLLEIVAPRAGGLGRGVREAPNDGCPSLMS